jgi:hypothetical protein
MTGIAIVLYLNQEPFQPRERDYAYAGSFYAFCIWIGIGVAGIAKLLEKTNLPAVTVSVLASALGILIPIQMASQTWDDHDRSGRYLARDFGHNYLESCEPNSIIFTHGDNDTFPLWYAQEVEGIRTDVRVCNTSYLQTDWYINQMKRQAYNSDPLPISWVHKEYRSGVREVIYVYPLTEQSLSLGSTLDYIKSDNQQTKIRFFGDILPASKVFLKIDSARVVQNRTVKPEYEPYIIDSMLFNFEGKNSISKVDAITLDMLNTNKWERPIYFAITAPINELVADHLQKTGMAYQVVPLNTTAPNMSINTQKMYDNVMHKFKWGGVEKPGLYLDENAMRMCKSQRMHVFSDLANALISENKIDSAIRVLDRCVEVFPEENVPYDFSAQYMTSLYYTVGENDKGQRIATSIIDNYFTNIDWMLRMRPLQRESIIPVLNENIQGLGGLLNFISKYDEEFANQYTARFSSYYEQYKSSFRRE